MLVTRSTYILSFAFTVFGAVHSPSPSPSPSHGQNKNSTNQGGIIRFPVTTVQIKVDGNQTTSGISRRQVPAPLINGFSGYYYLITRITSSYAS
jgi:hypothetical protein